MIHNKVIISAVWCGMAFSFFLFFFFQKGLWRRLGLEPRTSCRITAPITSRLHDCEGTLGQKQPMTPRDRTAHKKWARNPHFPILLQPSGAGIRCLPSSFEKPGSILNSPQAEKPISVCHSIATIPWHVRKHETLCGESLRKPRPKMFCKLPNEQKEDIIGKHFTELWSP